MIENNKQQYDVALRQTQSSFKTKTDLNPWFIFFLKTLEQQTKYLAEKIIPRKLGDLTSLEEQVYQLIKNHQPVTIGFLERESKMKRVTLKSILARLKAEGIITMEGTKKRKHLSLKSKNSLIPTRR